MKHLRWHYLGLLVYQQSEGASKVIFANDFLSDFVFHSEGTVTLFQQSQKDEFYIYNSFSVSFLHVFFLMFFTPLKFRQKRSGSQRL